MSNFKKALTINFVPDILTYVNGECDSSLTIEYGHVVEW